MKNIVATLISQVVVGILDLPTPMHFITTYFPTFVQAGKPTFTLFELQRTSPVMVGILVPLVLIISFIHPATRHGVRPNVEEREGPTQTPPEQGTPSPSQRAFSHYPHPFVLVDNPARVRVVANDEIGTLGDSANTMIEGFLNGRSSVRHSENTLPLKSATKS